MLTRSALSDRSILTEMFKYFSISDFQYFLKNRFVFHSNRNFLISKFLSIRFVIHFNVQMTGSVSKAGTILPPKFYLQDFATIWCLIRWLQFWPLALKANLATSWKFGHQVQNLVIRWRYLHWFQCCPPGWVTCIATLPGIALLTLSVGIDLVSSSARVTSVKSHKGVLVSDGHPDPKIGPQVYLCPIKRLLLANKH